MSVTLIKGDDPVLVAQQVKAKVSELLGDGDASLIVEELTESTYQDEAGLVEIAPLVNAAQTPPFLTDRRIVVGRNLGLFSTQDSVKPLVEILDSKLAEVDMVLVWEKGQSSTRLPAIPKSLKKGIEDAGGITIDAAPKGKALKKLVEEKLLSSAVTLDQSAINLIADNTGDNAGAIDSLLAVLESTFGTQGVLKAEDVKPFLGTASDIPPWDLTDAIDSGDIVGSLNMLSRMFGGGQRHPLQIMSILHGHYQKALALDGAVVGNEKDAAALLGMKGSTFPAKKALTLSKRLGPVKVKKAIELLAQADIDLRGNTAMEPEAVAEVLVARLALNSKR